MWTRTWKRWPIAAGAIVLSLMAIPAQAEAQVIGYGIAGPGAYAAPFGGGVTGHAAGGGELLIKRIAGAGAEFGLYGNSGGVIWVTSFNGVAHIPIAGGSSSPFVTGGYSRFSSGEGTFNAFNVGVGADFWSNNHAGVRVEIRDHLRKLFLRGTAHYFSFRIGIALK